MLAACGNHPSTQTVEPRRSAGGGLEETAYVEVNNHTGAEAAIYPVGSSPTSDLHTAANSRGASGELAASS